MAAPGTITSGAIANTRMGSWVTVWLARVNGGILLLLGQSRPRVWRRPSRALEPAGYHALEGLPAPLEDLPQPRAVLPASLALPNQGGVGGEEDALRGCVVAVLDLQRVWS